MPHHPVKLHLSENQIRKILANKPISVKNEHINHPQGAHFVNLHPLNLDKLHKAHKSGRGTRLHITQHECQGSGIWDWIKKGAKFVSDNWSDIQPYVSKAVDFGANQLAQSAGQYAPIVRSGRALLKSTTGVGINMHPTHFPGQHEFQMRTHKKKTTHKKKQSHGYGIIPAGYSSF